jgi:hypothetical protein
LTPSEVVALFGLDERRVRKDVEHGVFDRGKRPPRFALAEVVYLFAVAAFSIELGVDDRKKLYRLIVAALAAPTPPKSIELGAYLELKLASAVREVEARIERFAQWKTKLVIRNDILGRSRARDLERRGLQKARPCTRDPRRHRADRTWWLLREEQIKLLRAVASKLAEHGAMINKLLRVAEDGTMTFEISPADEVVQRTPIQLDSSTGACSWRTGLARIAFEHP